MELNVNNTKSFVADQNSALSTSGICLQTSSHTSAFNLSERFCDDPFYFCLREQSRRIESSAIPLGHLQVEIPNKINADTSETLAAYKTDFPQIVDQAAKEILILGREQRQAKVARNMSNGLLEMKGKNEQTTLEYCIQLYTKASFLYRACHRDLGDYYSLDDRKLFHYIKLLNWYIDCYGKSYIGRVYRGVLLNDERLKLYLTNDIYNPWYSLTYLSTSKSRQVAEIYGNVLIIIDIEKSDSNINKAVDISELSAIPDEEEVLLTPGYMLFKVKQPEFDPILKKHIIHLTSRYPLYSSVLQNDDNYNYRKTRRQWVDDLFSSTSEGHLQEIDSNEHKQAINHN